MQDGELISVVIPAYNRERSIARAIAAVLAQTYRRHRDRGGRRRLDRRHRRQGRGARPPQGPPGAPREEPRRGGGAQHRGGGGPGAFIAFQDSDDDWLPEKLARQAAHMASLPDDYVATFCTKIDYGCDQNRNYGPRLVSCMPDPRETIESGDLHRRLMRGNIIGPQTVLIDKAAFLAAGGMDEKLRNNEDWDFFIRLSERGKIGFLDDPLALVLISEDGISRQEPLERRELRARLRQDPPQDRGPGAPELPRLADLDQAPQHRPAPRRPDLPPPGAGAEPARPKLYAKYLRTYV